MYLSIFYPRRVGAVGSSVFFLILKDFLRALWGMKFWSKSPGWDKKSLYKMQTKLCYPWHTMNQRANMVNSQTFMSTVNQIPVCAQQYLIKMPTLREQSSKLCSPPPLHWNKILIGVLLVINIWFSIRNVSITL